MVSESELAFKVRVGSQDSTWRFEDSASVTSITVLRYEWDQSFQNMFLLKTEVEFSGIYFSGIFLYLQNNHLILKMNQNINKSIKKQYNSICLGTCTSTLLCFTYSSPDPYFTPQVRINIPRSILNLRDFANKSICV